MNTPSACFKCVLRKKNGLGDSIQDNSLGSDSANIRSKSQTSLRDCNVGVDHHKCWDIDVSTSVGEAKRRRVGSY
jgi:hypothetical protein